MRPLLRSALAAVVAALIVAGTETVAGYPRPTAEASAFFYWSSLSYFPLLLAVAWIFLLLLPARGLDLWFPISAGAVRVVSGLGAEFRNDIAVQLVSGLGMALVFVAVQKLSSLSKESPPFFFGLTVGMVLPVLGSRVTTGAFGSSFETTGRASATGALVGILAFVVLRGVVAKWPRIAPVFVLGPVVSLGVWGSQRPREISSPVRASGPAAPLDRPDIVLVVLDTVRAQSLASYGHSRKTMPHLEAFARQATTFEKAWTNGSWTLPGHISLFSGLRLTRHGYDSGFSAAERSAADLFLAPRLRRAGYATGAVAANFGVFGREDPALQGFDRIEVEPLRPFAFRPWLFDMVAGFPRAAWLRPQAERFKAPTMRAPWAVERGLRFWSETSGRPRFLFVNFMDAHLPWVPAAEDLGRFGPVDLEVESEQIAVLGRYRNGGRPTALETALLRMRYDESLHSLDRSLARLIEGVAGGPMNENTIVVVTSDHGESLGEHDRFGHRNSLDEEATRIPLIVRGPGLRPGDRRDAPVQLTDVFGYLIRSAGLELEPGLDARPFGERRHVVIEHRPGPQGALPASYPRGDLSALVDWPFKYVEGSTSVSLFDLSKDPGESQSLVTTEGQRVEAMRQILRDLSGRPSGKSVPRDRGADERLRALGYVR